jgi:D-hexose-6-phosphate mutarotase
LQSITATIVCVGTLTVNASASIENGSGSRMIPVDIVYWNPWIDKAKALADLGDNCIFMSTYPFMYVCMYVCMYV